MQRLFNSNTSYEFRNGALGLNIRKLALWTPEAITTGMWLDANDSSTITIATGVSEWRDKSGNARHATQATGASQPLVISAELNSNNVIRFDGSGDNLEYNGAFLVNTDYTVYAVVTRRSSSRNYFMGGAGSNTNQNLLLGWDGNTTADFSQYGNDLKSTIPGYSTPSPDLYGYILNSATGRFHYRNGSLLNSVGTTSKLSSHSGAKLGRFDQASVNYNGDIAEIVVTTNAVSTANRQNLEGYLAHKWGLTASLPNDHPYKSTAPLL